MSPEAELTCKWTALHPLFVGSKSSSASHDGTAKNTVQMFPLSNPMSRKQQVSINSLLNTRFRVNSIPRELSCNEDIIYNECHVQPHVEDMSFHRSLVSHKLIIPSDSQREYDWFWAGNCHGNIIYNEKLHLLHCRRRWGQRMHTWQGVPGWASRRWRTSRHKSRPLSRASSISPRTCFERRRETTHWGLHRPLRSFGTQVWGAQMRMPFETAASQPSITKQPHPSQYLWKQPS